MSGNKKRPRAALEAENVQPLKIDEDLLCLICTELVVDAKQTACCGGLFCAVCINVWFDRDGGVGNACPNCRTFLVKESIVPDLRSERNLLRNPVAALSTRTTNATSLALAKK